MKHPNKKKKQILFMLFISTVLFFYTGCKNSESSDTKNPSSDSPTITAAKAENKKPITKSSFKLNTIVTITIYDSNDTSLLDGAIALCDTYEALFSRTLKNSEINQLNKIGTSKGSLSDSTLELIRIGLEYSKLSNGAFDISVAPLTTLWDFSSASPKVPSKEAIKEAVSHIDYNKISLSENQIILADDNMGIDLGAIAKGYIADRIKDYLIEQGVKSAMIDLGGNILLVGSKIDDSDFRIGIQNPFKDRNESLAAMELSDVSIVSSGIYERYFIEDDILYHHILNPKTGYPYETGLLAVTIVSKNSVDGDALSTTAFALGLEEGLKLINSIPDTYAVFITEDYNLHYSDGFLEAIPISS